MWRIARIWFAALLLTGTAAAAGLPWIEDDYGRALAAAKARNLPLFVEVWAPW